MPSSRVRRGGAVQPAHPTNQPAGSPPDAPAVAHHTDRTSQKSFAYSVSRVFLFHHISYFYFYFYCLVLWVPWLWGATGPVSAGSVQRSRAVAPVPISVVATTQIAAPPLLPADQPLVELKPMPALTPLAPQLVPTSTQKLVCTRIDAHSSVDVDRAGGATPSILHAHQN